MFPNFSSAHLTYTPITNTDIAQLATSLSDFSLQRLVNPGMSFPMTPDDLLNPDSWLQTDIKNPNSVLFAIRTQKENEFIGICALAEVHTFYHRASLGINIANQSFRGRGFGTETMHWLLNYGFTQLNLNRIMLQVVSFNENAIHVYEKVGFQHEARERDAVFHDGQHYDYLHMSILRSEWQAHVQ